MGVGAWRPRDWPCAVVWTKRKRVKW